MNCIEVVLANKNIKYNEIKTFNIGDIVSLNNNNILKLNNKVILKEDLKETLSFNDKDEIIVDLRKLKNKNKKIKEKNNNNVIDIKDEKNINKVVLVNNKLNNFTADEILNVIKNNNVIFSSLILKYIENQELINQIKEKLDIDLNKTIQDINDKSNKVKIDYVNMVFDLFEKEILKEKIKNISFI